MRLIDADKLHKEIGKLFPSKMPYDYTEDDNDLGTILCDIGTIIDNQPTVDEKPVIHAKWEHVIEQKPVYDEHDMETIIEEPKTRCSHCKKTNKQYEPPYCPHCGARMDEEENNGK